MRLKYSSSILHFSYRRGQNCWYPVWYPSVKERKTHNGSQNNLKLIKVIMNKNVLVTFLRMVSPGGGGVRIFEIKTGAKEEVRVMCELRCIYSIFNKEKPTQNYSLKRRQRANKVRQQ